MDGFSLTTVLILNCDKLRPSGPGNNSWQTEEFGSPLPAVLVVNQLRLGDEEELVEGLILNEGQSW